ncbi:RICIN domain-containing protein [Streptomyces pseudogriseolus]|uniref:RICIN domain-containing protein n=1 Tax=Streptomyces pseudogriseolus TaxID=36817 RepID=UPI001CE33CC7|nr:RICIN domain-containing protein [Streptomyces pseudogriseolus]
MRMKSFAGVLAIVVTGTVMTVTGPAVAQEKEPRSSDTGQPRQLDETHTFQNLKSGKVLQAVSSANGAKVVQQPRDASVDLQEWFLVLDEPYRSFENFESGLNLGIDGASTAAGAAAITARGSSDTNQDWLRDYDAYGGDYFALKNRKSGLCLGISGASTANGAQAAQFRCDGSANQGWILSH